MTDNDPSHLCPELQMMATLFVSRCASADITVKIIVTWRSCTDQAKAKVAHLSNASAGQSPHNHVDAEGNPCSLAWDFGVFDDGKYITDGTDIRYAIAGTIAKNLGLKWGGDWVHPDYDHIELENWKQYRCVDQSP